MICSSVIRGLAACALTLAATVTAANAQSIVGKDKTGPVPNPVNLDITGLFQAKFVSVGDDMFIGGQPTEKALRDLKAKGVTTVVNLRMPEEMAQVGFDDVAATLSGSGNLSVLFGDGTGTGGFAIVSGDDRFLTLTIGATDDHKTQRDVKVGDFNGDAHDDLAVSVQGLDAIAVFSGDGEGGFTGPDLVSTGADSGPTRLAVGDLNDDGVDDLVAVGAGSSKVIVVLSDP